MTPGGLSYATLRTTLRPPRVAVVFDGGPDWHYWVRLALRACSRVWGGRGFVLVPHQDGRVAPEMLRAVRTYDPDYVVALERTYGTAEAVRPGSIRIRFDETRGLDGDERTKFIAEPFSSCVAVGFDAVQDEDGLHDRGRSAWAAALLDQDFPGLEGGDRAFAAGADLRVRSVDGLLPA